MSLESFFAKGKRPNEETEEEPTTSKKKKAAFKRQYQEKYGFVPACHCHAPSLLCIICGDRLANKTMKPSKLLGHMETKYPGLKDKPLEFFERNKREQEGQRQLLRATTSRNASALRASYLVAIAKAKKPFTSGEDLILPTAKDICRELLGEAAVKKLAQVPLSASTVTRRIEEIA